MAESQRFLTAKMNSDRIKCVLGMEILLITTTTTNTTKKKSLTVSALVVRLDKNGGQVFSLSKSNIVSTLYNNPALLGSYWADNNKNNIVTKSISYGQFTK